MGNPKIPIDLKILKGNSHLTKEEIEQRKEAEVKADASNIFAPISLSKKLKDRFNYLADELKKANVIANLDVETLSRYVQLEEQYNKVVKTISKCNPLGEDYSKLLITQTKIFQMLDKSSNELCLNIISRCKVSIPKAEEKPKNKFEKFGNGSVAK